MDEFASAAWMQKAEDFNHLSRGEAPVADNIKVNARLIVSRDYEHKTYDIRCVYTHTHEQTRTRTKK